MTMVKALKDPFVLISMLIGVVVLVQIAINMFPIILSSVVLLSVENESAGGIGGNFTFGSLFSGTGLVSIILSAVILVSVLALLGIKMKGTGR